MSIIFSFLIKTWYKFFISSFIVLTLTLSVSNLVSSFLKSDVTFTEVLVNYVIEMVARSTILVPLACLVASVFCINKLKASNELLAIFASGYTRKQVIYNIMLASSLVAIVQLFVVGYVEPFIRVNKDIFLDSNKKRFRNFKSQGLGTSTITSGKIWYRSDGHFISFSGFDEHEKSLSNATIYYFGAKDKMIRKIMGKKIIYNFDNNWTLIDGQIIKGLEGKDFPEITKYAKKQIRLDEMPNDFKEIKSDITTLSLGRLFNYIHRLSNSGINTSEYKVLFLNKIASSVISILFALMGLYMMFSSVQQKSPLGMNIVTIFIFTLVYWLINTYLLELGRTSKISPYLACFALPLLFFAALMGAFRFHRRLR